MVGGFFGVGKVVEALFLTLKGGGGIIYVIISC